jgi:hypothetical protein
VTFLPVLERELRVAARKRMTIWNRFAIALLAIGLWVVILEANRTLSTAQVSRQLFVAISVIGLIFTLFAGIFLTSDCLSIERREGTLGLLFLTDLKGYDVVLGKLAATSIHAIYGLLAIIPVLGLPLLMGGVSAGQFYRTVLVLLLALLFSLSVGLFWSSVNTQSRQALSATLLTLVVAAGVLPSLGWLDSYAFGYTRVPQLFWFSPVHAYIKGLDGYYYGSGRDEFWITSSIIAALSVGLFVAASLILPRVWQEGSDEVGSGRRLRAKGPHLRKPGSVEARMLDSNPYQWLVARDTSFQKFGLQLVGLLAVIWLGAYVTAFLGKKHVEAFVIAVFVAYALHQAIKWLAALEITRQLIIDKQSGALELIMVTPLPGDAVFTGQRRAYRNKLRVFLLLGSVVSLALVFIVFAESAKLQMQSKDQIIFAELFLGGLMMLWLDLRAMEDVGMAEALRGKKHSRAMLGTIGKLMLVPWAAVLFLIFTANGLRISQNAVPIIFGAWFGLGVVVDVVLLTTSMDRLIFREERL